MAQFLSILHTIGLIALVILLFNFVIFFHELGHFLAARWRGLKVDRFQIWFGKPLWKKTVNGVQYGLGWLPAGGFVSLPQMAPMESIEGSINDDGEPLPPITPLDKIIVAFAGPLFSIILALSVALLVWGIGKPIDIIASREIGYVMPQSPAEKAGLKAGDIVEAINQKKVTCFAGSLDGVMENIMLSRGESIQFTIKRAGEILELTSSFDIPQTTWFERSSTRRVGIAPVSGVPEIINILEHSPAAKAGLQVGDQLLSINGAPISSDNQALADVRAMGLTPFRISVKRGKEELDFTLQAAVPIAPENSKAMLGMMFAGASIFDSQIIHPTPFVQFRDSIRNMTTTIGALLARNSSVKVDQLSGPIGIAKMKFQLLESDMPIRRILFFMVFFNVNLAVMNMLPLPVLDGGHIVLAMLEKLFGRPVGTNVLGLMQTACALVLMFFMLYVSMKDIQGFFPIQQKTPQAVRFAP